MRRSLQLVLFALLIGVLVSVSGRTAQSSPPTNQGAPARIAGAAPPLQAPQTPYLLYFPLIGSPPDLTIAGVRVIQGTTASGSYATFIADRPTTVRVLVSVSDGFTVSGVTARMYAFDGFGNSLGSLDSYNAITAPSDESSMERTVNFSLPPNWLEPNVTYYIDLNQFGAIPENRSNNRYPATGRAAFNFVPARPLNVVIVPILYLPAGVQQSTVPAGVFTNDFSYLTSLPAKVFPVPNVTYTVHPTVPYEPPSATYNLNDQFGDGWPTLLQQITALRNSESEDPYPYHTVYYGLVNYIDAHGCPAPAGCTIGIGWIGAGATSVGWTGSYNGAPDATNTMTHEMGHNFGRQHVACTGQEQYPDESYPYNSLGGSIGVWGLDVATGELKDPAIYKDYMSYCEPYVWTSDYTFAGIKSFRDSVGFDQVRLDQSPVPALYVSGTIAPDGSLTLRPVYQQLARVNVPSKTLGPTLGTHTLELLGDGGKVLAAFPFTPQQIADSEGASGFGFFVPAVDGLAGLRVRAANRTIKEKTVAAPMAAANFARQPLAAQRQARGTVLSWTPAAHPSEPVVYRVRLSRDAGATWQVMALDWGSPEFTAPTGVDVANAMIEVQASDGIHTTTRTFSVGANP